MVGGAAALLDPHRSPRGEMLPGLFPCGDGGSYRLLTGLCFPGSTFGFKNAVSKLVSAE